MALIYKVRGWDGKSHIFTATELCRRVIKDSKKSNYSWIAPAEELVRVCSMPHFNKKCADTIKVAILNCYTSFRRAYNCGGDYPSERKETAEAVRFCYNSLHTAKSDEAENARKAYLKEVIRSVTSRKIDNMLLFLEYGKPFDELRERFEKDSFKKYASESEIDFSSLNKTLNQDFEQRVERAKKTDKFKKAAEEEKGIKLGFFESADYVI